MHLFRAELSRLNRSMDPGLALFGVWFAGVSLGLLAARSYGDAVMELSIPAGSSSLRWAGALMVTVLPLFLSAFAVSFFHRAGAYGVCGLRGFCMGVLLGSLYAAGGIWLCLLLAFSGLCFSPVLLWFSLRRLRSGMSGFLGDMLWCILWAVVISAVDIGVCAPFLARALSY